MVNCICCDKNIPIGTGTTLIQNTGKQLHFCSSKCQKNMTKLKRKPRKLKWSGLYEKGK
ncbi:50S ribosomal protein L24e [archaeon]|nr:50S ribosomal protein L24e [archaeon]